MDTANFPQPQASKYFHGGKGDLLLLIIAVLPLLVVSFFDASLGLLAFCLLMWVTVPWAYLEKIDKQVIKYYTNAKKEKATQKELEFISRPYRWVRSSTRAFFTAGIFFLMDAILELGQRAFPTLFPETYGVIFWAGVIFIGIAMFEAYRMMEFVLYMSEISELTYKDVGVFAIIATTVGFLGSFNAIELLYILPRLGTYGWVGLTYGIAILLSFIGSALLVIYRKSIRGRTVLGLILFMLPWIVLGLWAVHVI